MSKINMTPEMRIVDGKKVYFYSILQLEHAQSKACEQYYIDKAWATKSQGQVTTGAGRMRKHGSPEDWNPR